jgi:hypothetical protein
MTTRDIFIITSVINTGDTPWSYSWVRSVFTPQERFEQSLHTIESIRMYAENAFIIHVECSDISEAMTQQLQERSDVFLQCKDIPNVRDACLNSEKKGYGEIMKTLEAVNFIEKHNIAFNRIFKISGRYFLTERFLSSAYPTDAYGFLLFNKEPPKGKTVIYSVPHNKFKEFQHALHICDRVYQAEWPGLEDLLPPLCNPIVEVPVLGAAGYTAIDYSLFEA